MVVPINALSGPQSSPNAKGNELVGSIHSQVSAPMRVEQLTSMRMEQPKKSYFELPVGPMMDLAKVNLPTYFFKITISKSISHHTPSWKIPLIKLYKQKI